MLDGGQGASRSRRWLPWILAGLVALLTAWSAQGTLRTANAWDTSKVSDAVPLYLPARAVIEGLDPTDPATLRALMAREQHQGMKTQVLSTLYPPSNAVLLAPLARSTWPVFLVRWRAVVLVVFVLGCGAAGWACAAGRWAPLGAAIGAWLAVAGQPLTLDALGLGQANLLISGLMALTLWAFARDRPGLGGAVAMLGAAVKLVPAMALWPLLAARRWRGLIVTGISALALASLTLWFVPLERTLADLERTVRFQQGVVPAWVGPHSNAWAPFLGLFRHGPLGLVTLGVTGVCAGYARSAGAQRGPVLAGCLALGTAWLGADGAAVGVFYGLLLLPALVHVGTWPLASGAPRWAWAVAPIALAPWALVTAGTGEVDAALQMFLAGLLIWLACLVRLAHSAWRWVPGRAMVGLGLAMLLAMGWTANRSLRAHDRDPGAAQQHEGPQIGPHIPGDPPQGPHQPPQDPGPPPPPPNPDPAAGG